jgi:hypothetical protein
LFQELSRQLNLGKVDWSGIVKGFQAEFRISRSKNAFKSRLKLERRSGTTKWKSDLVQQKFHWTKKQEQWLLQEFRRQFRLGRVDLDNIAESFQAKFRISRTKTAIQIKIGRLRQTEPGTEDLKSDRMQQHPWTKKQEEWLYQEVHRQLRLGQVDWDDITRGYQTEFPKSRTKVALQVRARRMDQCQPSEEMDRWLFQELSQVTPGRLDWSTLAEKCQDYLGLRRLPTSTLLKARAASMGCFDPETEISKETYTMDQREWVCKAALETSDWTAMASSFNRTFNAAKSGEELELLYADTSAALDFDLAPEERPSWTQLRKAEGLLRLLSGATSPIFWNHHPRARTFVLQTAMEDRTILDYRRLQVELEAKFDLSCTVQQLQNLLGRHGKAAGRTFKPWSKMEDKFLVSEVSRLRAGSKTGQMPRGGWKQIANAFKKDLGTQRSVRQLEAKLKHLEKAARKPEHTLRA